MKYDNACTKAELLERLRHSADFAARLGGHLETAERERDAFESQIASAFSMVAALRAEKERLETRLELSQIEEVAARQDWSGKLAAALAETRTACAQKSDREVSAEARATNWKTVAKAYRRLALRATFRLEALLREMLPIVGELEGRVMTLESNRPPALRLAEVEKAGEQLAEALEAIRRSELPARPDHPAVTAVLEAWRVLQPKEGP